MFLVTYICYYFIVLIIIVIFFLIFKLNSALLIIFYAFSFFPVIHYLSEFIEGFDASIHTTQIFFMQSDGGLCPINDFIGSRAILSGPAGGVIGYSKNTNLLTIPSEYLTKAFKGIIGFDMGGTSTDVSRFDLHSGQSEIVFDSEIAGISIKSPHLDINTVAAGGGSRLFFENNVFKVGPESSGASPGPICYGNKGFVSLTDANLLLGRIQSRYFPKIFGSSQKEPLDLQATVKSFEEITKEINASLSTKLNIYEVAFGFVKVANENMCRPIRNLTQGKGIDPRNDILNIFGGAGGQHACEIAEMLGISAVFLHKYAGILSAYGLAQADVVAESSKPRNCALNKEDFLLVFKELVEKNSENLEQQGFSAQEIQHLRFLNLRYQGTDTALMIVEPQNKDFEASFVESYKREFGFFLKDREILVDNVRVRSFANKNSTKTSESREKSENLEYKLSEITPLSHENVYFFDENAKKLSCFLTPAYDLAELPPQSLLKGPAIILNGNSTLILKPNWQALITLSKDMFLTQISSNTTKSNKLSIPSKADPIELAIFANRFMSIAEQMGRTLQRTSISTNIKERLDFSCALFGPQGDLVANAPHLPVHLGSMQETVKFQINHLSSSWKENEVIITNHPKAGGSHLPDITVISPVWHQGRPVFYVASRGHHSDIGGATPGSMPPNSRSLEEEGVAIVSEKLVINQEFQEDFIEKVLRMGGSRCIGDNISDLKAQVAANNKGISLVNELIGEYGLDYVLGYMKFIQENAEECVRKMLVELSLRNNMLENDYVKEEDFMDDGTIISLKLTINRNTRSAIFDFSGTGLQVLANTNNPRSVTMSAIIYCLRCLVNKEIPLNSGCMTPINVIIPPGSLLDPDESAAIVGGNVLTSQRVTDVVLKAFKVCAASQGCMNNVTFGTKDFSYYETIAGGGGAGPGFHGQDGVHSHMTNTRITDPEILEIRYPVILRRFGLRQDCSGGAGEFKGGEGTIREFEFLEDVKFSVLSERRVFAPYGMMGGKEGKKGINLFVEPNTGKLINIGGKNSLDVRKSQRVIIISPGGGGYGIEKEGKEKEIVGENKKEERTYLNFGSLGVYEKNQEGA